MSIFMRKGRFSGFHAVLFLSMMGAASTLSAQTENKEVSGATDRVIEEVTVTAQKREESLYDVPISIEVLDGQTLENDSIHDFEVMDERVPNFLVARSPGANAIFIRGLGSGSGSPTLEQSVVMFVDEIYAGNARQFQTPWLDVERVEVLRGPQGYLVGKNTSAGAIRFVSKRPGPDFEADILGEWDFERDGPTVTGVVSGPVSDKIGLRGAVKYRDVDGYIYNSLTGSDEPTDKQLAGRLIGTYDSGGLSIMAKVEATNFDKDGNPYVMTSTIDNRPLDRTKESGSSAGPDGDSIDTQNAALHINYKFANDLTFSSITGYSAYESTHDTDADFFEADLAFTRFYEDFDQVSQEFRLLSPVGETFDWIVGLYLHNTDLNEIRITDALFFPAASSHRTFVQSNDTVSAYGNVNWRLTPQWSVQAGLRYTDESKDATYVRIAGPGAWPDGIGNVVANISDSISDSETDGAISLQWRPSDPLMLYASYNEGHKSGGFQGAIPNATATAFRYGPEDAKSWEGGLKGAYASGSFQVAVFNTKYKDLQVSAAVPTDPNSTVFAFFTGNAAEATSKGVEFSGTYRFTDNFRVQGSVAWLDAKFDSYPDGPCHTGQPADDPAKGSCSLTGVDLPFAPRYSGFVTASYNRDLSGSMSLVGDLTVTFRDDFRTDAPNDPLFVQKAYQKLDARVGLRFNENWEVALVGRNLTDEYTFGFGGSGSLAAHPVFGFAPDARMFPLDPPRTLAVQVRWTY